MFARKCFWFAPLIIAALLGGCATASKTDESEASKTTLESSLAEATAAQRGGHPDQAMTVLKSAAARYPADKSPWVRMAQIKFDAASYGEAIMNALEALQRDPADNVANSIVTVSGLRLATKSLSDLRTQNALSGSVKTEAQDLAKLLRDNLGESVLVPPASKPVVRVQPKVHPSLVTKTDKPGIAPAKAASSEPDSGKPNPFGGLK